MKKEEIAEKIKKVFEENGYVILQEDEEDVDLSLYIPDSLTFMQLVIQIEDEFQVEFPDELLVSDLFSSLRGLSDIIDELVNNKVE